MNFIMQAFGVPLGWIMWVIYGLVKNYALTLIIFTIVIKLCLVPLAVKQQISSIKMQRLRPKIQAIQEKYKQNPQKMQEELTELYKRENYSMSAGCLPLLIQMPILFGLLDVIYRPLTHIMRIPAETVMKAKDIITNAGMTLNTNTLEIDIFNKIKENSSMFAELGTDVVQHIQTLDMTAFGLDLSMPALPNGSFMTWYVLIPLLSGITAFIQGYIIQKFTPGADATGSMKYMHFVSAGMSFWIATIVPIGVGMYWIFTNIFGIIQSIVLNAVWNPKEIAARLDKEEAERKEKERQERIEAKKLKAETGEEVDASLLSKKEQDRLRLAEARRRNAEKYGDYTNFSEE